MKIVIQRVSCASVGVEEGDDKSDAEWLAKKILDLRIFSDSEGKMNLSVKDVSGDVLCISQFTLIAEYKKGNRPSFIKAAKPEKAIDLFEYFKELIKKSGSVKNTLAASFEELLLVVPESVARQIKLD